MSIGAFGGGPPPASACQTTWVGDSTTTEPTVGASAPLNVTSAATVPTETARTPIRASSTSGSSANARRPPRIDSTGICRNAGGSPRSCMYPSTAATYPWAASSAAVGAIADSPVEPGTTTTADAGPWTSSGR